MAKRWNSANKYAQQCHIVLLLNMAYLTAGEADINLGTVNLKAAQIKAAAVGLITT